MGNFPDLASARVAQSLLEGEGIESEIPDEFLSGIDWRMNTALHGVRLRVAPEDAESARLLLESDTDAPEEEGLEVESEQRCPECGATSVGPPRWKRRMKAVAFIFPPVLLLYAVLALTTRNTACYSCGHSWDHLLAASE